MSTTTTFNLHPTVAEAPARGFFAKLIEARTREGKARVRAYLERLSDSSLADMGFNASEIEHIRRHGEIPASFWR